MILFILQIYLNPPLGSLPETWTKYISAVDIKKRTFKCFNEDKIINLTQVNDNYLDCNDGSDEPGTALQVNGKFYCKNKGSTPKIINSWSVNDGICDCCDGSDELYNPHANCLNVCTQNSQSASQDRKQKFTEVNSLDSNNQLITKANIDTMNFKFKTKNISFIEYFFISLWKDFL